MRESAYPGEEHDDDRGGRINARENGRDGSDRPAGTVAGGVRAAIEHPVVDETGNRRSHARDDIELEEQASRNGLYHRPPEAVKDEHVEEKVVCLVVRE